MPEISSSPKMATLCLKKWSAFSPKPYNYLRSLISIVFFIRLRLESDMLLLIFFPSGFTLKEEYRLNCWFVHIDAHFLTCPLRPFNNVNL